MAEKRLKEGRLVLIYQPADIEEDSCSASMSIYPLEDMPDRDLAYHAWFSAKQLGESLSRLITAKRAEERKAARREHSDPSLQG